MVASQSPFNSKSKLREFMLHSSEGITDLINTLAHPKRLEILINALGGAEITFRDLQEKTELQKSALSHHLSVLSDKSLIDKKEKGIYQITIYGDDLLEKIAQSYLESKLREQQRLERLLQLIGKTSPYISQEVPTMGKEKEILKIVQLPKLRVVSFHVKESKSPEGEAESMLEKWAKPKGMFDKPDIHQVYGFNNPNPTKEQPLYGYEFWVTIPDDFEVESEMTVKTFDGGLYAVMSCQGVESIGPTWGKLVERVTESKYNLVKTHQWLEHHVNPHNTDPNTFVLDLYAPIAD
ncbi:MAG: effector binding domain-containing protein [Promethearchaeota archaeon]|jgi:DNA gyrase inhibitor GyrI/DNA-binding transcriptional ArsR family regulator